MGLRLTVEILWPVMAREATEVEKVKSLSIEDLKSYSKVVFKYFARECFLLDLYWMLVYPSD